jgi:hypothetical protein
MAIDFRANQIQTRHLIASGSFSGPGVGSQIAITRIENDSAPINQGNLNADVLAQIEQADVFFFVSGSVGGKGSSDRSVTLFGGDVHVSGNFSTSGIDVGGGADVSASYVLVGNTGSLNNNRALVQGTGINFNDTGPGGLFEINVNSILTGTFITPYNTALRSKNLLDTANVDLIKLGTSPLGDSDAALFVGGAGVELAFLQAQSYTIGNHYASGTVIFHPMGLSITDQFQNLFAAWTGDDAYLFVDGFPNSRGTSIRGTAVFAGDVHVSGNITSDRTLGLPTRTHVGSYVSTTAIAAAPQAAGGVSFDPTEHHTGSCVLASVMAATVLGTTASVQLYNSTSGSYVEIGGPGITYLHVTASNATKVESVNLFEAANFGASESIYLIQVHTTGSVLNTVIHYGSDLVTYR